MPSKDFMLDDLAVTVYKRRSSRNLRLSITPTGKVRVSIPAWAPYSAGLKFAQSRQTWIREQQSPVQPLLDGQAIGKAHHLYFAAKSGLAKPAGRVYDTSVVVSYPSSSEPGDPQVQRAARQACIRALRVQAKQLLPQRLADLASTHQFDYTSVSIKQLKSRWGSCDHESNIVLNLYLMQLPWELIDYVLMHELTHTKILRHGKGFWQAMVEVLPNTPSLKKRLRTYQPIINGFGQSTDPVA
ncbi:MAG: SprT family zinc-dependent metalloprotease [Patescibacteria group bacterium]